MSLLDVLEGQSGSAAAAVLREEVLFGPGHPAALLQAADLPLQQEVGFLQLSDLLDELAYVLQIIQT